MGHGFYLVPTPETMLLANVTPDFGTPWTWPLSMKSAAGAGGGGARYSPLSAADWRPLQHVIVHALARHPARCPSESDASICVVATPPQQGLYYQGHPLRKVFSFSGGCGSVGDGWAKLCPRKPLVVIDVVDADFRSFVLCETLWDARVPDCLSSSWRAQSAAAAAVASSSSTCSQILRVVGSGPLTKHPKENWPRSLLAHCPMITVPWLSHARDVIHGLLQPRRIVQPIGVADAKVFGEASPPPWRPTAVRDVRIAGAWSTWTHGFATSLGWSDWRRDLRNACARLHNLSQCTMLYQSAGGGRARYAVDLYARSVFCLQPPGDVVVRGAIVDAIAMGCIPVLLHRAQAKLWPLHWDAARGAVLFDWSSPANRRNATSAHPHRQELGERAAKHLLMDLLSRSDAEIADMQHHVARAARRIVYRDRKQDLHSFQPPGGASGASGASLNTLQPRRMSHDAVDILVDALLDRKAFRVGAPENAAARWWWWKCA